MILVSNSIRKKPMMSNFNFDEDTEFNSEVVYKFRDGVKDLAGKVVTVNSKKEVNAAVVLRWIRQRDTDPNKGCYDLCYESLNGLQGIIRLNELNELNNCIVDCFNPTEENVGKLNYKRWFKRYGKSILNA